MILVKAIRIRPLRVNGRLCWRAEWWESRAGTWYSKATQPCMQCDAVVRFIHGYIANEWTRFIPRGEVRL